MPCPTAKLDAIVEAVTFSSMQKQGGMATMLLRKGGECHPSRHTSISVNRPPATDATLRLLSAGIGDWRNHLDAPSWAAFDAAFDAALEGSSLAEPLRYHQVSARADGLLMACW